MKICIVGGGSSGWMTATTICQLLDFDELTLIESADSPISGVGESTIQQIREWVDLMGIDEEEMIRKTDGSLKHSIKFTNFFQKNSGSFHYPFGDVRFDPKIWWSNREQYEPNEYAQYLNPLTLVAEEGKFDITSPFSFHFDAVKFGHFLRENYCEQVNHITANVIGCDKDISGIKSLHLDNKNTIEADLFIDCTGFRSLLLGEYLEEPFIPFNHLIPNDSAWATQVPYSDKEKELVTYTECTAIDNGWVWNIPLWKRIGTGYVYSSKHVSDEDAKKEFIEHLKSKGYDTEDCKFKKISMRVGRHQRTFVKNVVAIGLSAGFIEPLESNGLFTVHENLIDLWKTLRRGKPSQFMKDMYNMSTANKFDEFAEFVAIHYAFTQRDDTNYWRDIFNRSYELNTEHSIDIYGLRAFELELYKKSSYDNTHSGFHYIASGMDVCAYTNPDASQEDIQNMETENIRWKETVERLPSVFEVIKNIHN